MTGTEASADEARGVEQPTPPLTDRAAVATVEQVVESAWFAARHKSPAMAAVVDSLPTDSVLTSALESPVLVGMMPEFVVDLVATPTQEALLRLFSDGSDDDPTLGSLALARLVVTSAWHTHQQTFWCIRADVVDAAIVHLRTHGPAIVTATARVQGASSADTVAAVAHWHAYVEYVALAVECARRVSLLPDDAPLEQKIRLVATQLASQPLSTTAMRHRAEAAVGRRRLDTALDYEYTFSPHVGLVAGCVDALAEVGSSSSSTATSLQ